MVNEVLSEANTTPRQVIDHFGDVDTMRKGLFESESLCRCRRSRAT